jgi:hypothetical protein
LCDDWWDATEGGTNCALVVATQVVKDAYLRQAVLRAQKVETISVAVVQFFHLLAGDVLTTQQKIAINNSLKNLLFFTHQNFLILIQILLTRMVKQKSGSGGSANTWATNLEKVLDTKMLKRVKTKGEAV